MTSDRRDFDFVGNHPGIQNFIILPVDILGLQHGANYIIAPTGISSRRRNPEEAL